jgi:hypothetical protein
MTVTEENLQLDSVRFGLDGAAELDRGRALVFVPHEEITRIELMRAVGVNNPLLVGAAGILVVLISFLIPLLLVLNGALRFRIGVRLLSFPLLAIPGAALIRSATRKRWVVVVHTFRGQRRLIFQHIQDRAPIEQFLDDARARFGYLWTGNPRRVRRDPRTEPLQTTHPADLTLIRTNDGWVLEDLVLATAEGAAGDLDSWGLGSDVPLLKRPWAARNPCWLTANTGACEQQFGGLAGIVSSQATLIWVPPRLFVEWTRDNLLRHPMFLGVRDDVRPTDVRRETPLGVATETGR